MFVFWGVFLKPGGMISQSIPISLFKHSKAGYVLTHHRIEYNLIANITLPNQNKPSFIARQGCSLCN